MEGQTLSHYKVLEKLGGGGMGVVYKALDTKLNRHVALKFLPPELTRVDDARERFILEAQAASALDHPNICTIHEIDATPEGQQFIAMAFYDGETLKKRLQRGPLPVEHALDIAIQIARGLRKAHEADIIHRDIKPANVMLTTDGFAKIVDFGIAKLLGVTGPTQTGTTLGTVSYMSPEQIAGKDADQQSDVWALGAVLYEMLTGQQPFKGESQWAVMNAIENREPEPPSSLRSDISPEVQALVLQALQKPGEKRYESAGAFLKAAKASHAALTQSTGIAPAASGPWHALLTPRVAVPLLVAGIGLSVWGVLSMNRGANERRELEQLIPEIQQSIGQAEYVAAFDLAVEAERLMPASQELAALWPQMSLVGSLATDPPGAEVYYREYGNGEEAWRHVGQSPLEDVRLPRGIFEWRIELDGYQTRRLADPNPSVLLGNLAPLDPLTIPLQTQDSPSDMVLVPAGEYPIRITGFQPRDVFGLDAFLIDRYEVTNQEFQEFMDAGGYEQRDYWEGLDFVSAGRTLSWTEAMAEFQDSTGRPGPATWVVGQYPDGEGEHPVTGVSWYEAAAFANFKGKSLPTFFHWARAAMSPGEQVSPLGTALIPASNFDGDGPASVGTYAALGPFGTFDMPGNVREWIWNATGDGDDRLILGGAWNDAEYMAALQFALSPFDRSPENGFRCVRYLDDSLEESLAAPVEVLTADYRDATPVSDELFEAFRRQFSYVKSAELNATIEVRDESPSYGVRERVVFDAAYGGEQVTAQLMLPEGGVEPPYQVVVWFPGLARFQFRGSSDTVLAVAEPFARAGRAVVLPVWKGSFERWDGFLSLTGEEYSVTYRNRIIEWYQDLARTVDYLETRSDLDTDRIAFFGASFGASAALPLLAVEPRLKTAILLSGGLVPGLA